MRASSSALGLLDAGRAWRAVVAALLLSGCGGGSPQQLPPPADGGADACSDACAAGATRCSGDDVQVCAPAASGCLAFGDPAPCAGGGACANGACAPACTDHCTLGAVQCAGGGVETCAATPSGCADWGAAKPCAAGLVCSGGTCAPTCADQCALGAEQCSGSDLTTCVTQSSGCADWGAATPCGAGMVCSGGACVASCTDQCTPGAKQCSGTDLTTCVTQSSGCADWDTAAPCGAGLVCSGGACVVSCTDQCTSGATQCSGNGVATCGVQASGCTDWDAAVACGTHMGCSGGACVVLCTDQCTAGAAQCSGNGVQTCGVQASGCTDWDAAVACGTHMGCSGGACVVLCTDQCIAGATQCSGSGVETCGLQASGCTDWDAAVACGTHMGCSGGACVVLCTDQCTPGAQQCVPVGLETCGTQASGCTGWSAAAPCVIGDVCDPVDEACVIDPLPPRLISPLGGSLVSGGVVLRWETDPTASDSVVRICADLNCLNVVTQVSGLAGATLSSPLPRGVYFVQGRGRRTRADLTYLDGSTWTRARAIFVTGRPVTSPALLGLMPDLDGDGIPEKIIADTFPPTSVGATIWVGWGKGGSTTLNGGWTANGVSDSAFGAYVQNASDIDGDGRPELVTIEQLQVSGGSSGSPTPADPLTLLRYGLNAQGALVQLQTFSFAAPLHSIVPVGDLDGDGYADVLAVRKLPRVFLDPYTTAESGVEVIVVHGGPMGFASTETFQVVIPPALRTYSTQMTVRAVGDVDGDGFPDVAFGVSMLPDTCVDPPGGPPPPNRGYVDIMRGAATAPLQQQLLRIDGIGALAPLGDVDGDGRADVGAVIPARLYQVTLTAGSHCASYTQHYLSGSMNVYYGAAQSPLATTSWTLPTYSAAGCQNGWNYTSTFQIAGSLAGGGDLDGDTFGDVVLATPALSDVSSSYCPSFPGEVRLFYGSAGGLLSPPDQVIDGPDGNGRLFGRSVAIIGDVGGDGRDDLLVGASDWHDATHTVNTPARVRLYSGARDAVSSVATYASGANPAYNQQFGSRLVGGL